MSTTIFCTFDQQDFADLAMGELRATTTGIKSIHYVGGAHAKPSMLNAHSSADTWAGIFPRGMTNDVAMPSNPVNVKIVCSDAAVKSVKSRLVNLHAYQIVTMR